MVMVSTNTTTHARMCTCIHTHVNSYKDDKLVKSVSSADPRLSGRTEVRVFSYLTIHTETTFTSPCTWD